MGAESEARNVNYPQIPGFRIRNLLTYFNVLFIMIEYILKTKKRSSRSVSFPESCREVRGSSVNSELVSEFFC